MHLQLLPNILLALAFTVARAAADDSAVYPPIISTTGSAKIRVAPDFADLSFDAGVRHADLASARKEQAERITKVLAVLRAAGIEEKDIQTSPVGVFINYVHNGNVETATIEYYDVSQEVSCTLRDVKKIGEVTANVLLAGVDRVSSAILRTSNSRKLRDEARIQAARAAREKAVTLATELGAKVGKPYSIVEDTGTNTFISNSSTTVTGDVEEPQVTFAPGMVTLHASVRVSFLLE